MDDFFMVSLYILIYNLLSYSQGLRSVLVYIFYLWKKNMCIMKWARSALCKEQYVYFIRNNKNIFVMSGTICALFWEQYVHYVRNNMRIMSGTIRTIYSLYQEQYVHNFRNNMCIMWGTICALCQEQYVIPNICT